MSFVYCHTIRLGIMLFSELKVILFQKMGLKGKEKEPALEEKSAKAVKRKKASENEETPVKKFHISVKMQSSLMADKQTDEANSKKKGPKIIIAKSKKEKEEEKSTAPPKKLNKVLMELKYYL